MSLEFSTKSLLDLYCLIEVTRPARKPLGKKDQLDILLPTFDLFLENPLSSKKENLSL